VFSAKQSPYIWYLFVEKGIAMPPGPEKASGQASTGGSQ
jgi:hypothetical protein